MIEFESQDLKRKVHDKPLDRGFRHDPLVVWVGVATGLWVLGCSGGQFREDIFEVR